MEMVVSVVYKYNQVFQPKFYKFPTYVWLNIIDVIIYILNSWRGNERALISACNYYNR